MENIVKEASTSDTNTKTERLLQRMTSPQACSREGSVELLPPAKGGNQMTLTITSPTKKIQKQKQTKRQVSANKRAMKEYVASEKAAKEHAISEEDSDMECGQRMVIPKERTPVPKKDTLRNWPEELFNLRERMMTMTRDEVMETVRDELPYESQTITTLGRLLLFLNEQETTIPIAVFILAVWLLAEDWETMKPKTWSTANAPKEIRQIQLDDTTFPLTEAISTLLGRAWKRMNTHWKSMRVEQVVRILTTVDICTGLGSSCLLDLEEFVDALMNSQIWLSVSPEPQRIPDATSSSRNTTTTSTSSTRAQVQTELVVVPGGKRRHTAVPGHEGNSDDEAESLISGRTTGRQSW